MSILVPLPKEMRGELCFECKFIALHEATVKGTPLGEQTKVFAMMILLEDPLFADETGFTLAPLCGHCAEVAVVDGVLPKDINEAWRSYVLEYLDAYHSNEGKHNA